MIMTPSTRPAASTLNVPTSMPSRSSSTIGRDEVEGEEAVDHRRDAGEHLEHRLEDLAHARRARTRRGRRRPRARTGRAMSSAMAVVHSVPVTSGRTPKLLAGEPRRPAVPVRKSTTLTSRKNSSAGKSRARTMPDRDDDGERGRAGEDDHDDPLAVPRRLRRGGAQRSTRRPADAPRGPRRGGRAPAGADGWSRRECCLARAIWSRRGRQPRSPRPPLERSAAARRSAG